MTESLAEVQQKQKMETDTAVKHIAAFTIVAATALLAMLGGEVLYAQGQDKDKYSLISPGGIAFSDFRGYEDWSVVSSARTEEVLKVIVANPTMINAYKARVPGNGHLSAGLHDREAPVEAEEEHGSAFRSGCARYFQAGFRMEKDSKTLPKTGGWGYAAFNYDAASDTFTADPTALQDCGDSCHVAVKAKDYIFHPYQRR